MNSVSIIRFFPLYTISPDSIGNSCWKYYSGFFCGFCNINEDTIIDGVAIPPGSTIMAMLMAASLDPALHDNPLKFDLERVDKTHFAFGGGAHFCLGALLAKAEAEIAIERLLARYPALALAGRPIERNVAPAFNGFAAIWLRG